MMQKKKQASIAAFFSPQAKTSKPAAKRTAANAEASAKETTVAAKEDGVHTGLATSGSKRARAPSASKEDGETELAVGGQTPPPPGATTTTIRPPAMKDQKSTPVKASVATNSDNSAGNTTIVDLFTTPPPTKRAKPSVEKTVDVIEIASAAEDKIDRDVDEDDADDDADDDDDDDEPPSSAGPHAMLATDIKPKKPRARKQPKAASSVSAAPIVAAESRQGRSKPSANPTKSKASTTLKTKADAASAAPPKGKEKKQVSGKEKAQETVQAEQKQPAVVLDPVVKARIDTYQQKIDELTRQCTHLLNAPTASDGILQEIYGVAIDLSLELNDNEEDVSKAVADLNIQLLSQPTSQEGSGAVTDFSPDIKTFIARSIQGRTSSLSSLSLELLETLEQATRSGNGAVVFDVKVKDRVLIMLEMEIKMLAQRQNYGVRPAKANLFEDTTAEALWIWEIGNVEKYFVEDSQKTIKRMRRNRRRLGQQLKTLARVVQLLHQVPVDEVKVSAEEAKVGKFVLSIEGEIQKAQDRERKELEKVQVAEQKKQQELEKEHAKQEEKRKREEDEAAEKVLANKRKKSLVSYFRSIDKSSGAAGDSSGPSSSGTGSTQSNGCNAEEEVENVSSHNATMARMDSALDFLVGGEKKSAVPGSVASKSPLDVRALVLPNGKKKTRVAASSGHWSSKQRRDPVLGVMKMFQFHENHRPAFYGTFSTKSNVFHGGRRPFAQYSKFDYAVDSEEEWEEEEPGESLSDADSDMDESDDDLDYGDQWLAYEDEVDYIDGADDEMKDDGGDDSKYLSSPERRKKIPSQLEQKKRARVPGRKKAAKAAKLEPQIIGPYRCAEVSCVEHLSVYAGQILHPPVFESTLLRKAREYEEEKEEQERQRLLQGIKEKQMLLLQHQEDRDALGVAAAPELVAEQPSENAAALRTPQTTPQKRKLNAENTLPSPSTASNSGTPVQPVKAGITAWLQKPAVVDRRKQGSDA